MRETILSARRQSQMAGILLTMLLFRAYVPIGFMPASGTPFLLELCPGSAPMSMPMTGHHHHHSDTTHNQFEVCPFGSASASGPIAHLISFAPPALISSQAPLAGEPARISERVDRAHPPRGPPSIT